MTETLAQRMDNWLAAHPHHGDNPLQGMAEAGLLQPADSYADIAAVKAVLVGRTGLLGIGGIWGGRQQIERFFLQGFGSAAQKAQWSGKALSVAISEPKVGAHPKLLTTRAEPVDGGWRINGEKAWVSNGPLADAIIVVAITAQEGERKRYSAFLVPSDTPGLSMEEMPGFHALRPSRHCHMKLDGCVVPDVAMLGEPGTAYERMAMRFRDVEDAVGTYATLGAFRFLTSRLRVGGEGEGRDLSLGALIALEAVYEAGAASVVATLDGGRLNAGSATLVGLRVLAIDMAQRIRTHVDAFGPRDDMVDTMLADLDATLAIARGPRLARQARLATGR
ncbi:MAG: acyl-CoA dehydrogenase [Acetobacteraceae bacterium]